MTLRILSPDPENVALAAEALKRGEVVGMPTETVYGLAGSAFDPRAIERIFAIKGRPAHNPVIVHVAEPEALEGAIEGARLLWLERSRVIDARGIAPEVRRRVEALLSAFWPGPFTLVLPRHPAIPAEVAAGLPSVAVRMPRHPTARALIRAAGFPLAAPSANRSGHVSPTTAAHVAADLGDRIAIVLDGGPCEVGLESTVLAIEPMGALRLLRPGGIGRRALEAVAGCPVEPASADAAIQSPGMLEVHYAPRKALVLLPGSAAELDEAARTAVRDRIAGDTRAVGLLVLSGVDTTAAAAFSRIVSVPVVARSVSWSGDTREAARNLYAALRELDASEASILFAEPCRDDDGLGRAIADRLRRAGTPLTA